MRCDKTYNDGVENPWIDCQGTQQKHPGPRQVYAPSRRSPMYGVLWADGPRAQ